MTKSMLSIKCGISDQGLIWSSCTKICKNNMQKLNLKLTNSKLNGTSVLKSLKVVHFPSKGRHLPQRGRSMRTPSGYRNNWTVVHHLYRCCFQARCVVCHHLLAALRISLKNTFSQQEKKSYKENWKR